MSTGVLLRAVMSALPARLTLLCVEESRQLVDVDVCRLLYARKSRLLLVHSLCECECGDAAAADEQLQQPPAPPTTTMGLTRAGMTRDTTGECAISGGHRAHVRTR